MAKTKVHGEYLDPSVISGQTQVTAVGADSVLIFDATDNALKKALLSDVIETVGSTPSFTSATISGDLTVDTTTLKVDSSNDRVGIGTDSPGAKLDVNSGTVNTLAHFHSTDDNAFIELKDDDTTGYIGVQNDYLYIGGAPSTNTQNLVINDGTGFVGIGVTSPSSVLHVASTTPKLTIQDSNGSGNAATPYVLFEDSGGTDLGYVGFGSGSNSTMFVTNYANADLEFLTNSSTRMTIKNSGAVGIGTANPDSTLHVKGAADAYLTLEASSTDGNTAILMQNSGGTQEAYILYDTDDNNMQFGVNSSERLRIDSSGIKVDGVSNYTGIEVKGAGASRPMIQWSNVNQGDLGAIYGTEANALVICSGSSNTAAITIDSSQKVHMSRAISSGVQTTVLDLESVNSGDQNSGQTCQIDFSLIDSNTNTGVPQVRLGAVGNDTGNQAYEAGGRFSIYLASQNYPSPSLNEKFRIDEEFNGDTYTNDGTVSSLSDVRVKTNIQDLTDGIDVLKQLRPVTFEYNNDGSDLGAKDGVTRYGLIADEVKSVAPHYVNESTGYIKGELVKDYKTLSLTRMIPMLMKSIQEQQEQIETLKKEVEELK